MTEATALVVDPTNAEQARAWDGGEGVYWAGESGALQTCPLPAITNDSWPPAEIGRTERVLDIGCGTGQTTRDAARAAPDGTALGVDLSGPMIALARRLAAEQGVTNALFEKTDAQEFHPFPEQSFDVAISRTGTMFFGDQVRGVRQHRPRPSVQVAA